MNKIKQGFILGLLACLSLGTLWAGPEKKSYEQALKAEPNDGIVVFLYGPDWEKKGPELLTTLWKNSKIRSACGGANMVAIPIYQRPNEKETKEAQERGKGFKRMNHVRSIPALVLQTSSGEDYYAIYGDELNRSAEKVADLMKSKFELYKQRRTIMKKAEKAKGRAKARAYGEAAAIEGIFPPKDAAKIIRENDPNLEEPLSARAVFDIYKLMVDATTPDNKNPSKKIFTVEEALAQYRKLMEGDKYTSAQKQEIIAATAGYLRRKKYDQAKVKKMYEEMLALDPDSVWGAYAKSALKAWY